MCVFELNSHLRSLHFASLHLHQAQGSTCETRATGAERGPPDRRSDCRSHHHHIGRRGERRGRVIDASGNEKKRVRMDVAAALRMIGGRRHRRLSRWSASPVTEPFARTPLFGVEKRLYTRSKNITSPLSITPKFTSSESRLLTTSPRTWCGFSIVARFGAEVGLREVRVSLSRM